MNTPDPYDLGRFLCAQEPRYGRVLAELCGGHKRSHWIWFIFPQLKGLGSSPRAQHFGIASLGEARAYLAHPLLGARLRECTQLVMAVEGASAQEILGYPDDLKFRSSMTLFRHAATADAERRLFEAALAKYFAGEGDPLTRERLTSAS